VVPRKSPFVLKRRGFIVFKKGERNGRKLK
jgi:hypothetical protein